MHMYTCMCMDISVNFNQLCTYVCRIVYDRNIDLATKLIYPSRKCCLVNQLVPPFFLLDCVMLLWKQKL